MKKIVQIRRKGKVKKARAVQVMELKGYRALELDSKVALIQELIPLGPMHGKEVLQEEVKKLAGERYKRDGLPGHDRWGNQRGFVYIKDQRIPVMVQRVRDTVSNREVKLPTYERLQRPSDGDEGVLKKVLHGLSCRNYRDCAEAIPEALSLSSSTVSRRYIRASSRKLCELMERRLDRYDFVALVVDGKSFGEDEIITGIGITKEGKKVVLGIVQAATENSRVCREFLLELIERGLRYENGLLCVIDGAKGVRKAIHEVFGPSGSCNAVNGTRGRMWYRIFPRGFRAHSDRGFNPHTIRGAMRKPRQHSRPYEQN